jgi:hypothetical protein
MMHTLFHDGPEADGKRGRYVVQRRRIGEKTRHCDFLHVWLIPPGMQPPSASFTGIALAMSFVTEAGAEEAAELAAKRDPESSDGHAFTYVAMKVAEKRQPVTVDHGAVPMFSLPQEVIDHLRAMIGLWISDMPLDDSMDKLSEILNHSIPHGTPPSTISADETGDLTGWNRVSGTGKPKRMVGAARHD